MSRKRFHISDKVVIFAMTFIALALMFALIYYVELVWTPGD